MKKTRKIRKRQKEKKRITGKKNRQMIMWDGNSRRLVVTKNIRNNNDRYVMGNIFRQMQQGGGNDESKVHIRFYDNALYNVNNFRQHFDREEVQSVWVEEVEHHYINELSEVDKHYYNTLKRVIFMLDENDDKVKEVHKTFMTWASEKYHEFIHRDMRVYNNKPDTVNMYAYMLGKSQTRLNEMVVPRVGFSEMDELVNWANGIPESEIKMIIFDWDQTLAVTEGFYPQLPNQTKMLFRDMAVYLMGGYDRYKRLIQMFDKLRSIGSVEIFILTNNAAAIQHRQVFLEVIRFIIHGFVDANLLYGGVKQGNEIIYDKGYVFKEEMCKRGFCNGLFSKK